MSGLDRAYCNLGKNLSFRPMLMHEKLGGWGKIYILPMAVHKLSHIGLILTNGLKIQKKEALQSH